MSDAKSKSYSFFYPLEQLPRSHEIRIKTTFQILFKLAWIPFTKTEISKSRGLNLIFDILGGIWFLLGKQMLQTNIYLRLFRNLLV